MTSLSGLPPGLRRRLTVALALACLLPAACTSAAPGSPSTPRTPASSSTAGAAGAAGTASGAAVGAGSTPGGRPGPDPTVDRGEGVGVAATPDPEMTVIESASVCTTHRQRDDASYFVPVQEVIEGAAGIAWSGATEVVPGPDAADPSRCPVDLRPKPFCEVAIPWTGLSDDSFVTAGRLERAVAGSIESVPPQADGADPADGVKGLRQVRYQIYDLKPGDPGKVEDYLGHAVRLCARARDVTVATTAALVGAVPSEAGAGSAQVVLLHRGARLVWVVLDGDGWRAGQRERALGALVHHLL